VLAAVVRGLAIGGLYGLLALSLALLLRGTRALSFAHGEIGGFAALIAIWAIQDEGWPWLAGAMLAVVAGASVAAAFELLVGTKLQSSRRVALTTATVGLLLLVLAVEQQVWGVYPKPLRPPVAGTGFEVGGTFVTPTHLIAAAVGFTAAAVLTTFLRRTSFGLAVVATAADREEAALAGLPVRAVSLAVWATSGGLAAVAALLVAPVVGAIGAGTMTFFFLRSVVALLLGGTTSLVGPVVGGLVVGVVEQVTVRAFVESEVPAVDTIAVFGLLLAVVALRPTRFAAGAR
jgi:branched-chain amino acid transport system permease protein